MKIIFILIFLSILALLLSAEPPKVGCEELANRIRAEDKTLKMNDGILYARFCVKSNN